MATTGPVVYQVGPISPTGVVQSAELRPEQLEQIPFPLGASETVSESNWPPAGFTGTTMPDSSSTTTPTASQLPEAFNLEWVQGDTATFQWLFTDVAWTEDDPELTDEDAPTWVETNWAAQVRNPYIISTFASDYWVPAYGFQYNWWRGHSLVAEFDVTSEVIEMPGVDPTQWATKVTAKLPASRSCNILPGNWYRWDMQTRTVEEDEVETRLRGRARIVTEWTVA